MKKKGFTLIELLAVIVILGIIMLITTPIVLNVIKGSRYGAFGVSKKNIERAVELYYTSNSTDINWDNDEAYVTIKDIKDKGYLKKQVINNLNNLNISDDVKVLIYKDGNTINYSLQMYEQDFFKWYQEEMIKGSKKDETNLPANIGDKKNVELNTLMDNKLVDELRLPFNLKNRCVGYVEIEKTSNNKYEYNAFLDCGNGHNILVDSSYVNFGGNYLDEFNSVKKTKDGGYIAVGRSNSTNLGETVKDNIDYDGLIVKFRASGEVEWFNTFGGSEHDNFYDVVENSDSYIAVGEAVSTNGDLTGFSSDIYKSVIVIYDKHGSKKDTKILYQHPYAWGSLIYKILIYNNNYYISGASRNVDGSEIHRMFISKLDFNFNVLWEKGYGGSNYASYNGRIAINNNKLVLIGDSRSNSDEMADIKIGPVLDTDAVIFEINMENGNIISKGIFGGVTGSDYFSDVIVVDDGYIAVGLSNSNDHDMNGINKGNIDAILVKFSNKPNINGILPIIYKKTFGGSKDDIFRSIIQEGNNLIVVGQSNSKDGDLTNIAKSSDSLYDGIIVKYSLNGDLLAKNTYGGSGTEIINLVIKDGSNFVMVGNSFSLDKDINSFNKGNSDAILVKVNSDLIPIKEFKLPTLLMDNPKKLIVNYGNSIPTPDNREQLKLYTTNDSTRDLESWCSKYESSDPNGNYRYISCIKPFDEGNINKLVERGRILTNNIINLNPEYNDTWIKIQINFSWAGAGDHGLDNFKLSFKGKGMVTINEAVNLGYIEPLVVLGAGLSKSYWFHNTFEIINGGPVSGKGQVPAVEILFKLKNQSLEAISFNSNTTPNSEAASYQVDEFKKFDISITPAVN